MMVVQPTILIEEIKAILILARQQSVKSINAVMLEAYWLMGKRIVEEEQHGSTRAQYGEKLITSLSSALVAEFGKGFSVANLKNIRQFYLTFQDEQNGYALRSELSWTHYRLIMRVKNKQARDYYISECAEQRWSTRTLERNINSFYYDRLLSSKNGNDVKKITSSGNKSVEQFIKDPYVFEFLNIAESPLANERELETALINHLQAFLLELGKGFSFVGRQFRISSETSHFYIDLVFYNYILKCFVLIDLKTGKLKHQDIGQMDMYIRMFDDLQRRSDDNPTVGIILCTDKDETVIKYSVLNDNEQTFASQYHLYMPTEEELRNLIENDSVLFSLSHKKQENTDEE